MSLFDSSLIDLSAFPRSFGQLDLFTFPFGGGRCDSPVSVLDFLHLDSSLLLQSCARPELPLLVFGQSCMVTKIPIFDHMNMGLSPLLRSMASTGFLLSPFGLGRLDLILFVYDCNLLESPFSLRSFLCLGFNSFVSGMT